MTNESPLGRLLSVGAAAAYLGLQVRQLRRVIAAKQIAVTRLGAKGRGIGIYEADCDAWRDAHRSPAAPKTVRKVERAAARGRPVKRSMSDALAAHMPKNLRFANAH